MYEQHREPQGNSEQGGFAYWIGAGVLNIPGFGQFVKRGIIRALHQDYINQKGDPMRNKVNKSVWTPVCVEGNGNGKASPPRVVMAVSPGTECIRLPAPREKDPVFGLSRSYLNTLILPSVRNGNRILVRSYVLLRPGNRKGVRLIDIESLRDYVHAHVQVSHPVEAVAIPVAGQIRGELPEAA